MKNINIKLKQDHSTRGKLEPKGSEHTIRYGVGDDLIIRGIAEKLPAEKASK